MKNIQGLEITYFYHHFLAVAAKIKGIYVIKVFKQYKNLHRIFFDHMTDYLLCKK